MTWPLVQIKDVSKVVTGSTPKTNRDDFYGGGIPFVTPTELEQHADIFETSRTLSILGGHQVRLVPKGAVLVCCIGSLGKVGIAGRELATNQQINSVVFDERKVWPRFGYYACRLLKPVLENMAPATTVAIVSKSRFQELEIPLPPLDEQKRIAGILDQADALRTKRQHALTRLNQLGQAIFYEMFGEDDETSSNSRPLSSYLSFVTSGGRGWSKYYSDNGTRFLRSLDIQSDEISSKDAAFVKAPNNAEAKRTAVQAGDVLLTITGSKIGRVAPVPNDFGPAFVSQHVAILRLNKEQISPEFLSFYLNLPKGGQTQIAKNQYGQTKPGLNFDQIGRFTIPVVSIDRQVEFVDTIKNIDLVALKSLTAIAQSESLFNALQSRAFKGEL